MKYAVCCLFIGGLVSQVAVASPTCADPTTWCEKNSGDSGDSLNNADVTTGVGLLLNILGSLGNGTTGGDLYEIDITDPADFSATTENTPSKNPDPNPALYLFDSTGHAVYGIDDNSGSDTQATLDAGLGIGPQTAGLYYILIAPSGNMPQNGKGDDLFTLVTGADVAGNSGVLKGYSDEGCGTNCEGNYDITLTGASFAQTPEPETFALVGAGLLAIGLRRKRQSPK